ncbi:MAG: hypothetical protein BWY31_01861 [Lentisphaerae bacterium ADurb.Bin242]|nr:MAG: hypothetical protein BWY31_01861 [Lentisphaerae bacterium ADurb.Bin242]
MSGRNSGLKATAVGFSARNSAATTPTLSEPNSLPDKNTGTQTSAPSRHPAATANARLRPLTPNRTDSHSGYSGARVSFPYTTRKAGVSALHFFREDGYSR